MKKKLISLVGIITLILLVYLPITTKYVIGIAGNTHGNFVIGLSLMNSENRHDLLFYNSECLLVNTITLYKRGGITIGNYNDYLAVQDGLGKTELYDFSGNKISEITYTDVLSPEFYYNNGKFTVNYKKDILGNEKVFYNSKNGFVNVDFNYDFYKKTKLMKVFFHAIAVIVILLAYRSVKNKNCKSD